MNLKYISVVWFGSKHHRFNNRSFSFSWYPEIPMFFMLCFDARLSAFYLKHLQHVDCRFSVVLFSAFPLQICTVPIVQLWFRSDLLFVVPFTFFTMKSRFKNTVRLTCSADSLPSAYLFRSLTRLNFTLIPFFVLLVSKCFCDPILLVSQQSKNRIRSF